MGALRREGSRASREALRFPTVRRLANSVRTAWLTSDPAWVERMLATVEERPEDRARREAARQEREHKRAQLAAHGPAVYAGELRARAGHRGVTLVDHQGRPDVRAWLCDVLGLDGHGGGSVRARLIVELLDSDPSGSGSAPSPADEVGWLEAEVQDTADLECLTDPGPLGGNDGADAQETASAAPKTGGGLRGEIT